MFTNKYLTFFLLFILSISCGEASQNENSGAKTDSGEFANSTSTLQDSLTQFEKNVIEPFEAFEDSIATAPLGKDTLVLISPCNLVLKSQLFSTFVISRPVTYKYFHSNTILNIFSFQNSSQRKEAEKSRNLIMERDSEHNDLKWPSPCIIYYSICKKSFPREELYQKTVQYMNEAAKDWSGLTNVKYHYLPAYDPSVKFNNVNVQFPSPLSFIVAYQQFNTEIFETQAKFDASQAVAFNKEFPMPLRVVRICPSFFSPGKVSKAGILKHEIGHIMGFRHEHASDKQIDDCPMEDFGMARHVTSYDPNSVMHYACGGFNNYGYQFTNYDSLGIKSVYH